LTLVAPVAGVAEDQGRDHAECGSLACASVLRTHAPGLTMPALDNSSASMLQAAVRRALPSALTAVVVGRLDQVVAANVGVNRYVVGLVHCTGQAVPCPPAQARAAHWIALFGLPGSYYQVWDSTFHSLTAAELAADSYFAGPHLVVWFPTPPAPVPPLPQEDDAVTMVAQRTPGSVDPAGAGAVWLVRDKVFGPKRHITGNGDLSGYLVACGQAAPAEIDAYVLDRMERGPDIDNSVTSPPEA
jgi:hypothetical protein